MVYVNPYGVQMINKDDCILYAGVKTHDGYGLVWIQENKKTVNLYLHRVMYENFVGPIPDGLQVDHLCSTPECINTDHLEPVTGRINTQRKYGIDLCKRGHSLIDDAYEWQTSDGVKHRCCRKCKIAMTLLRYREKKLAKEIE